jgi:hypothetical protein
VEPGTFDGTAGIALLLLLPTSVLFVAAAIRRSGAPRWAWACFLFGTVGVLVLLHLAGGVRYPVDAPERNALDPWDFFQFVGLGAGRIGVVVNAVVATARGLRHPVPYDEVLPRRETALVVAAYSTMAVAAAVPAVWWASGLGVVPLPVELPVVLAAVAFLTTALLLRWRRLRVLDEADRPIGFPWPADAVVAVWLVGALAAGPLVAGSGLPDGSLVARPDEGRPPTAPRSAEPEWPGPTPVASTSLDAAAIEAGTRALLADSIDRAGPLDDLTSPTPAPADAPPVVLVEQACDQGGRRWTGSLVLPTVRPQDLAPRVLAGWRAAGYVPIDRAMGTDVVGPVRPDAAVERMRLGGGTDGVHLDVRSFCTSG